MFLDIFFVKNCLEIGKTLENNDFFKGFGRFLFLDPFESRKCLKTGEMTKSLDNNDFSIP